MSDFFTNLVARSFGTAPVIRPRLNSLFEPVGQDAASFRQDVISEHDETRAVAEEPVRADVGRDEPANGGRIKIAYQRETSQARPRSPRDSAIFVSAPASPVSPAEVIAQPRIETSNDKVSQEMHEDVLRQERVPTADSEPARFVSTVQLPAPAIVSFSYPRVEQAEKPGALTAPKFAPQMRIENLRRDVKRNGWVRESGRREWPEVSSQPEPSIHVTIGRIEVRAAKESSPPSRQALASPVMSLDEYLRNRARSTGQ